VIGFPEVGIADAGISAIAERLEAPEAEQAVSQITDKNKLALLINRDLLINGLLMLFLAWQMRMDAHISIPNYLSRHFLQKCYELMV